MGPMEHWYVLHAKPHKERQVADYLRQRRVEVFLPLARVNPVNPRAARVRPYFPCYLFVKIDLAQAGMAALQWTPGLRSVVQFGGQPSVVPENFIFALKRRVEQIAAAGGLKFDGLESGARVRIVGGPFAGYEAVFDARLSDGERVRVLLELIQHNQPGRLPRCLPLELDAGHLEPVRPRA